MTLSVISQVDNASQTYLTFGYSIVNTINLSEYDQGVI